MLSRFLLFLFVCLLCQTSLFSQTIVWNSKKPNRGTITFDDDQITLLIIDFPEHMYKFHVELSEMLEESDLKYVLLDKSQLEDSAYTDLIRYPLIIDNEIKTSMGSNGMTYNFLHLVIIDRVTGTRAKASLTSRGGKYCVPYKHFIKKIKKGESIRILKE